MHTQSKEILGSAWAETTDTRAQLQLVRQKLAEERNALHRKEEKVHEIDLECERKEADLKNQMELLQELQIRLEQDEQTKEQIEAAKAELEQEILRAKQEALELQKSGDALRAEIAQLREQIRNEESEQEACEEDMTVQMRALEEVANEIAEAEAEEANI